MIYRLVALILMCQCFTFCRAQTSLNESIISKSIHFKGSHINYLLSNPDSSILGYNRTHHGHYFILLSNQLEHLRGKYIRLEYGGEKQSLNNVVWFNNTCYVFCTFYNSKHHKRYLFYTTLNHKTLKLSKNLIKVAELSITSGSTYFKIELNKAKNRLLIVGINRSDNVENDSIKNNNIQGSYWVLNKDMRIIETQSKINIPLKNQSKHFNLQDIDYHNDGTFYLVFRNYLSVSKSQSVNKTTNSYWNEYDESAYAVIKLGNSQVPMIYETNIEDKFLDVKMRINKSKIHLIGLLNDITEPEEWQGANVNNQSVIHIELDRNTLVPLIDTFYYIDSCNYSHVAGMEVLESNEVLYVLEKRRLEISTIIIRDAVSLETKTITKTGYRFSDIFVGKISDKIDYQSKYKRNISSIKNRTTETPIFFTKTGYFIGFPDVYMAYDTTLSDVKVTQLQTAFKYRHRVNNLVDIYLHKKTSDHSYVIVVRINGSTRFHIHRFE
ncbi:MAG: hypothetical protein ACI9JN_001697 [Bacteroidia bacterium]|jgi:hypothetical protein